MFAAKRVEKKTEQEKAVRAEKQDLAVTGAMLLCCMREYFLANKYFVVERVFVGKSINLFTKTLSQP